MKIRSLEKSQKGLSSVNQAELDKEFQRLFFFEKADRLDGFSGLFRNTEISADCLRHVFLDVLWPNCPGQGEGTLVSLLGLASLPQ
jgi:hypothetical protein